MSPANNSTQVARSYLVAMLLLSLTLLTLNCLRAYSCGIEIDEADTYLLHLGNGLLDTLLMNPKAMAGHEFGMIDKWGSNWQYVLAANNHVLNTLATRVMVAVAGPSELSIRLPNLFFHLVYLCSSFYICRSSSKNFSGFLMFALINTNPFLLSWFALSRGYGLALGFEMLALAFLFAYVRTDTMHPGKSRRLQIGACLAAALATFSHLTFSHFYLSMLIVLIAICVLRTKGQLNASDRSITQGRLSSFLIEVWPLVLLASITLPILFVQIKHVVPAENWAVRGGKSLIDTVYSLSEKSLSPHISGTPPELLVWVLVFLTLIILSGTMIVFTERAAHSKMDSSSVWHFSLCGMLVLCISAQTVQHLLLQIPYHVERMALYFIPLYLLIFAELIHFADDKMSKVYKCLVLSTAVLWVACFTCTFISSYNLKYNYSNDDQDARAVLFDLARLEQNRPNRSRQYILSTSLNNDRCLEFYRQTQKITWLAPVIRDQEIDRADYYYASNLREVEELQTRGFIKIKEFSSPESVLLKNPALD